MSIRLSQFGKLFQNEAARSAWRRRSGDPPIVMGLFALSAALMATEWSQPISYLMSAILAAVIGGVPVCDPYQPASTPAAWRLMNDPAAKRARTP